MKEEEDRFEDFMHEIMQDAGEEKAPIGFTQRVMGQITATQIAPVRSRWKPVIGVRGWIAAVAGLVLAFVVSYLIPSNSSKALPGKEVAEKAIGATVGFFESMHVPIVLVASAGAIFLLFALDRALSARVKS